MRALRILTNAATDGIQSGGGVVLPDCAVCLGLAKPGSCSSSFADGALRARHKDEAVCALRVSGLAVVSMRFSGGCCAAEVRERINSVQKWEPIEIRVVRVDRLDAVFPHEDRGMGVKDQIA